MIVLDISESLMRHFDKGTMNHKEIEILVFLDTNQQVHA